MSILSALLTQDKVVTPRKIDEAIQRQVISGGDFETNLLEVNALAEDCLAGYAALIRGMRPARRVEVVEADLALVTQAPRTVLEAIGAFPLRVEYGVALVAASEPLSDDARVALERALGVAVEARYVCPARVAWAQHHHYDTPLPARTRRLIERLAGLDAGALPTLSAASLPAHVLHHGADTSSALATLEAALRDDDEPRAPSLPAPPIPPAADPFAAPTSRPAAPASAPPRMTLRVGGARSMPPNEPPSTRPLPPALSVDALVSLRAARVPDTRDLLTGERHLDLTEARKALAEATDREGVVDALLDHASQSFAYVALFALHQDEVSGLAARGDGLVGAPLRALGWTATADTAMDRARRDGVVVRAAPAGADREVAAALQRPTDASPRVFPLRLRSKVALLLWADDGERAPSDAAVTALEAFLMECAAAFARLILQKKRASRPPVGLSSSPSSLAPVSSPSQRPSIPSVEARAAALRAAVLTGERRASTTPRAPEPRRSVAPGAAPIEAPDPARLVAALVAGGPAAAPAERALLELGDAALGALFRQFPGPHGVIRADVSSKLPVASEQGPVLRAVVAHGVAAVPRLLAAVGDPDPDRRFCALLCLAEVVHPSAIPSLTALLTDADYPTRMAAIEALRNYRNFPEFSAVWTPLRAAIRDPRASVDARRAAAHAAGELRDSGAVTALVATLTERDASLVAAARRALVVLTRQDFGLDVPRWVAWWDTAATRHRVEWLIDALTHSDATVRHEASEELKRLTGQVFGYYFNLPRKERERAQQSYLAWWHSDPERGARRGE
jgi:HEAT repeats/Type II secretion system (T2SS), protein E, N-terminal domain